MKSQNSGIKRILKAFLYSWDGLKSSFRSEAAIRQELFLCVILLIVMFLIPASAIERLFLVSTLFVVILAELVNTAIEAVVDRISPDLHPLSKKAKDVGSLLVLVAFIYMFVVWGTVLYKLSDRIC